MTAGLRRRCPICERVMPDAVCPEDRMATLLVDAPVHDAPAPTAGEVLLGRYEVCEPIGAGGYGRIYRARHLGTGQDVALKVLRVPPDEDGAFAVQRFFLEARATSGLTHPNTVRVFDFGQDDAGRVLLAMELLAGRTLREELRLRKARGQRFSDAEVVNIGVAVTRSLAEAHELDVVHRDLKPDNIFLHQVAGDDPVVKVLDFGIAKLGVGHRHTLSSDTSVPGTPAYMAPEHALNLGVDGRTDLYALGVVLYQLLTLELPYQAPSDPQTLYMHAYEAVPDPRVIVPDLHPGLAEVVRRAMQKQPEARFADARAMRAALSEALAPSAGLGSGRVTPALASRPPRPEPEPAQTTGAVPIPRAATFVEPPTRSPAVLVAVGALLAFGLVGLGAWWVRAEVPAPPAAVEAPVEGATEVPPAPVEAAVAPPENPAAETVSPAPEPEPAPAAPPKRVRKKRPSRRRRAPKAVPEPPPPAAAPTPKPKKKDVLQMRLEDLVEEP